MSMYDWIQTRSDLITRETLDFLSPPYIGDRTKYHAFLSEAANHLQIPNEMRRSPQHLSNFFSDLKSLLRRMICIRENRIEVGTVARFRGEDVVVAKIRADFYLVLKTQDGKTLRGAFHPNNLWFAPERVC